MVFSFRDFKSSELAKQPHYAVVGHPISHSLSPLMHQTALDNHQIDATYIAIDLLANQLSEFISWCNQNNFWGCNITIPYKEEFMEIVDETDPFSKDVGVINTIVKKDLKLVGYNTDVFGFLKPLEQYLPDMDYSRAIIFGTGGASKAVKTALESTGFEELVFVSRHPAGKRIESKNTAIRIVDYNQWLQLAEETSLIVNTTPVGMFPQKNESFVRPAEARVFQEKICYDLVYNPIRTQFLKMAEENGAMTINGLDMLIYQGSKSFELWTGKTFPINKIRQKLTQYLNSSE